MVELIDVTLLTSGLKCMHLLLRRQQSRLKELVCYGHFSVFCLQCCNASTVASQILQIDLFALQFAKEFDKLAVEVRLLKQQLLARYQRQAPLLLLDEVLELLYGGH